MKLFAPEYYKKFSCIAEKCRHNCCIGWEIDIDEKTAEKYNLLTEGYGAEIAKSIEYGESPHFKLCESGRCYHLDHKGLCKIIKNFGEGYLCEICNEHPRFYNFTRKGKEVGIGMACEEACRIILSSDGYSNFIEIDEDDVPLWDEVVFDCDLSRKKVFDILSDRGQPYIHRVKRLCEEYDISMSILSDEDIISLIESLEYLDSDHKTAFLSYSSHLHVPSDMDIYLERFLAYFVFRHCSESYDGTDFKLNLVFGLFCERLFSSLIEINNVETFDDLVDLGRIISEEIEYSEENTEAIKLRFYEAMCK